MTNTKSTAKLSDTVTLHPAIEVCERFIARLEEEQYPRVRVSKAYNVLLREAAGRMRAKEGRGSVALLLRRILREWVADGRKVPAA